jgi:hypothetical protein
MKTITISILSISFSLFLFSCNNKEKKAEQPAVINKRLSDGFPENKKSVNCYLYSSFVVTKYASSSPNYGSYQYAIFSDPSKNLINSYSHYTNSKLFSQSASGNVDVGNVSFNGQTIYKNLTNEVYYTANYNSSIPFGSMSANWKTDGNKTFLPMDVTINKGHPIILSGNLNIGNSISKNSNFTLNISGNITNYDSLIVILEDGNWGGKIRKTADINTSSLTFTPVDMSIFSTGSNYGKLSIYAYNYSNMTVNNKVTLFELSNQYLLSNIYFY